MNKHKEE